MTNRRKERHPQLVRGAEAARTDGAVSDSCPTCPTWPTILAWLENDVPDEEAQLINTHVADCDECREKLELMNAVGDALTSGPGASTNR